MLMPMSGSARDCLQHCGNLLPRPPVRPGSTQLDVYSQILLHTYCNQCAQACVSRLASPLGQSDGFGNRGDVTAHGAAANSWRELPAISACCCWQTADSVLLISSMHSSACVF